MKPKPQRFYIARSSMFDVREYDAFAMRARLNVRGLITRPALSRLNGWQNQPEVLTFQLTRKATPALISEALASMRGHDGRAPLVLEKDW